MTNEEMTLDIQISVNVNGTPDAVFESVLHRFGEGCLNEKGESLNLKIETFAGGRWYRDRGNGIEHLWGHVQTIKRPSLLELYGQMFMSYPALNHLEIKLDETDSGTRVSMRHRALGMIDPAHRTGIDEGWRMILEQIVGDFSKTNKTNG